MCEIKLGDVKDLIKDYPDEYFDCIVSDVPYKICTGGARISEESIEKFGKNDPKGIFNRIVVLNDPKKQKWVKANYDADNAILISKGNLFSNCDIKFSEWLPLVYPKLKNGCHAYFMVNGYNLKELQVEAEKAGFIFQNLLVWVKNNSTPNKFYMKRTEFILMLRKGRERYINDMEMSNVFTHLNIIGNKFHPTEKPIELMKDLIRQSTNENDIVLDPFMGSGSTCLAAKELNRQYVGFEINQKYYDIAEKRLNQVFVSRNNEYENQIKLPLDK